MRCWQPSSRRHHLSPDDGDRFHGLRAAVGPGFWAPPSLPICSLPCPISASIVTLARGGYSVGNPTLNRFFSLHYLLPFVIAGVVVLRLGAACRGPNNPTGVEAKTEKDTVAFAPPRSRTCSASPAS